MSYISEEVFNKHLRQMTLAPYLTLDTEGTLDHPYSTTWGISYSAGGTSEYFAFNHKLGENLPVEWLPKLKEVIENHPCLVLHHAKHDLRSLQSLGINYTGKFYDTMLMAHYTNENLMAYGLDRLSKLSGGDPKDMPEAAKKIIGAFGWEMIPVDLMRSYADNDAVITDELFQKVLPEFQAQDFEEPWQADQDFIRVLMDMENNGVLIDQDHSQQELERGLG